MDLTIEEIQKLRGKGGKKVATGTPQRNTNAANAATLGWRYNMNPKTTTPDTEKVFVTARGKCYHKAMCAYNNHGREVTLTQALRMSKVPCTNCRPVIKA